MPRRSNGKKTEAEWKRIFSKLGKKVSIERWPDSSDIHGLNKTKKGIIVPSAPSDYVVSEAGVGTYFAEVKETINRSGFPFGNITKGEMIAAKKSVISGGQYFFFIRKLPESRWFKVPARIIVDSTKRSLGWGEIVHMEWELSKCLT